MILNARASEHVPREVLATGTACDHSTSIAWSEGIEEPHHSENPGCKAFSHGQCEQAPVAGTLTSRQFAAAPSKECLKEPDDTLDK